MNDYGMSPLQMMQMVGPMLFIVPVVLWLVVLGPLLLYPLARWRAHREGSPDNHLGLKVALHYFGMMAFQLVLLGVVMLAFTIISKGSDKGDLYRASFGFIVPGAIVFGLYSVFRQRTNDAQYPGALRLFAGYNLIVTGLFAFTALVLASQALFAKGSTGDPGRFFFASVVVYGGAWAACAMQFSRLVFGDPGASAGGPPACSAQPPIPPPPPSGPSLPPLSAGSFPPIDPKG